MDIPLQAGHPETLEMQLLQILCQFSNILFDDVIYFRHPGPSSTFKISKSTCFEKDIVWFFTHCRFLDFTSRNINKTNQCSVCQKAHTLDR